MTIIEYLNSHRDLPPMCTLNAMYVETENGVSTIKGDVCRVVSEPRKDENGGIYRDYPEQKFREFSDLHRGKDNVLFQVSFESLTEIYPIFYDGDTLEYIGAINFTEIIDICG